MIIFHIALCFYCDAVIFEIADLFYIVDSLTFIM